MVSPLCDRWMLEGHSAKFWLLSMHILWGLSVLWQQMLSIAPIFHIAISIPDLSLEFPDLYSFCLLDIFTCMSHKHLKFNFTSCPTYIFFFNPANLRKWQQNTPSFSNGNLRVSLIVSSLLLHMPNPSISTAIFNF